MIGMFQSQISGTFSALNPFDANISKWPLIQQVAFKLSQSYKSLHNIYEERQYCQFCLNDGQSTTLDPRARKCYRCGSDVRNGQNRVRRYHYSHDDKFWISEKVWKIYTLLIQYHKDIIKQFRMKQESERALKDLK